MAAAEELLLSVRCSIYINIRKVACLKLHVYDIFLFWWISTSPRVSMCQISVARLL